MRCFGSPARESSWLQEFVDAGHQAGLLARD
jgi:hypothetical protein